MDAHYFWVEPRAVETALEPGEQVELTVGFVPSSEQRSAILAIATGHPAFPELTVGLAGKVFFW